MDARKLPITGPCPIDLEAIGFDRRAKKAFCTHCSKNVVNLSNMTRDEARSFLRQNAGATMCVSYAKEADGNLRFRPEPTPLVPVSRLRSRPSSAPLGRAAAAAGLALGLAACTPHGDAETDQDKVEIQDDDLSPLRKVIPWTDPEPEPEPLAGAVAIPEPEMLEGEIAVPEDLPEEPQIEQPEEVEPCDKTPDRPPVRGRIKLPRTIE